MKRLSELDPIVVQERYAIFDEIVALSRKIENVFDGRVFLYLFGSATYLDPQESRELPRDNDLLLVVDSLEALVQVLDLFPEGFKFAEDISPNDIANFIFSDGSEDIVFFDFPTTYKGIESTIRIIAIGTLISSVFLGCEKKVCSKVIPKSMFTPKRAVPVSKVMLVNGEQALIPISFHNIKSLSQSTASEPVQDRYIQIDYKTQLEDGQYVVPRIISLVLTLYEKGVDGKHKDLIVKLKKMAIDTLNILVKFDKAEDLVLFLIRNECFSQAFIYMIEQYFEQA